MIVSHRQHENNLAAYLFLEERGYAFRITDRYYDIYHHGGFVYGAGILEINVSSGPFNETDFRQQLDLAIAIATTHQLTTLDQL